MIIDGLEYNAYYLYNPIWVNVSELKNKLNLIVDVSGVEYKFSMQPIKGVVRFDLASIVLGLVEEVRSKKDIQYLASLQETFWLIDGSYRVNFRFSDSSSSITGRYIAISKTFLLGGKDEYVSNVPVGNTLSLGLDKWDGYPAFDFKLSGNNIRGIVLTQVNRRKRLECTNAYILFRNGLGGMSSYLFEDFNIEDKGKDLGYYITDKNIIDNGTELTKSITLRTKLKREDFIIAKHLIRSQEVYLYEDNKLIRLVGASAISLNDKLSVQDFEISFNIPINYNPQW